MIIEKNDVLTASNAFNLILNVRKFFNENKRVISLDFNDDVVFIHPLFLILLLNLQDKYQQRLVLNVKKVPNNSQHYLFTFLAQYIDYELLKTIRGEQRYIDYESNEFYEKIIKNESQKIFLIHTVTHHEKVLTQDKEYQYLPIIRITNPKKMNLDKYNVLEDENDTYYNRKKIYKSLQLETEEKGIYINKDMNLWNNIFNIYLNLELDARGASTPLSDIVFECVDNIRRHTDINVTNGHVCFYRNNNDGEIELLISDNDSKGLLNTYLNTLISEKDRLVESMDKRNLISPGEDSLESTNLIEQYTNDIELLEFDDAENDIKVLEKLFDVEKTFSMHQARRIIMHFGIPMLMQLLKKLDGTLDIYVHRGYRYYQIKFINGKTEKIDLPVATGSEGTYIYITFPSGNKNISVSKPIQMNLKNSKYQEIFLNRKEIDAKIKTFREVSSFELTKEAESINNNYISQTIIVDYKFKKKGQRVGEYLRNVYRYTYIANIKDVLVINFPIHDYQNYLMLLIDILYPDDTTTYKDNTQLNIAFLDKYSASIAFIGGENKSEFCAINQFLAKKYNQRYISLFSAVDQLDENNNENPHIDSKLFYSLKNNSEYNFLPFTLFHKTNNSEYLLGVLIKQYLIENRLKLHVDTKKGYHLNYFYQFKNLFTDSEWINRIAFILANYSKQVNHITLEPYKGCNIVPNIINWKEKKIVFIGTDKYTNLTIAMASSFLNYNQYFIINDIVKENNQKDIKNFIDNNEGNHVEFVIFSSITFSTQMINSYICNYLDKKHRLYKWITVASILTDTNQNLDSDSITSIKLTKGIDYEIVENDFCQTCINPQKEEPLYQLDINDTFSLENFYKNNYTPKVKNKHTYNLSQTNWSNSVHFVHAKRGQNHYTFYTKTINFFNDNKEKIEVYLTNLSTENSFKEIVNGKQIIILAPRHNTNNYFITYVDKYLFNNDAQIYRFDIDKGEQNFYDIDILDENLRDTENNAIFFIDDEISSGNTMEYFYSLIKIKYPLQKFDASIVMIDRTTLNDQKIICNYIDGDNYEKKSNRLFSFTKLEIKPIKTETESCFLCNKQTEYKMNLTQTVLDMNRFQIANRIVKLNKKDAKYIDNEDDEIYSVRLKNLIKMYAVDYFYQNFDDISKIIDNPSYVLLYEQHEKKFFRKIFTSLYEYFYKPYRIKSTLTKKYFIRICRYEISISMIKALAFPKLAYYKSLRAIATKIVISRLRSKIINPETKFIQKNIISVIYNEVDMKILKKELNSSDSDLISFLLKYEEKNNMDYINFLYITAAYLDINVVLDIENINFYYNMSLEVKKKNLRHTLLHIYPTAVKLLTTKYLDKAKYFDSQLLKFYCEKLTDLKGKNYFDKNYGNIFSLINALFLENIKMYSFEPIYLENNSTEEKLKQLIGSLESYCKNELKVFQEFEGKSKDCNKPKTYTVDSDIFHIDKIYINEHINRKYDNYIEYLKNSKLRDITHDMKELTSDNEIYPLYVGAVSDKKNKNSFEPIFNIIKTEEENLDNIKQNIDCTWSNMWHKSFNIDNNHNKEYTIIRLVDVDYEKLELLTNIDDIKENINLWYKPIGLIVVSHDGDYSTHLVYSRLLLALQKNIVSFFKDQFDYGGFQEKIQNKYIQKSYDKLQKVLEQVSHTYGKYIKIADHVVALENYMETYPNKLTDKDILIMVKKYTRGLEYVFAIGSLTSSNSKDEKDIHKNSLEEIRLNCDFIETIKGFLEVAPYFKINNFNDTLIEESLNIKYGFNYQEESEIINLYFQNKEEDLKAIIFELIFNGIRSNKDFEKFKIEIILNEKFICVKNNGKIIEEIDKIFDKNYTKNKGSGIGLYNIKKYLENSDMIIDAYNMDEEEFKVKFVIRNKE